MYLGCRPPPEAPEIIIIFFAGIRGPAKSRIWTSRWFTFPRAASEKKEHLIISQWEKLIIASLVGDRWEERL
jgi:hypothetical protein